MKCFIILSLFFISFNLKAESENLKSLEVQIEEKKELYDKLRKLRQSFGVKKNDRSSFYPIDNSIKYVSYTMLTLLTASSFLYEPVNFDPKKVRSSKFISLAERYKIRASVLVFFALIIYYFESNEEDPELFKKRHLNRFEKLYETYKKDVKLDEKTKEEFLRHPENYNHLIFAYEAYFKELKHFDTFLEGLENSILEDEKKLEKLGKLEEL